MAADLKELAELAAARRLNVVRAYLPEPEAAEETQLLEGLYSRVVPWSVLTDWPGFYRELKPLEYWELPSWRTTWGWKVDDHHRLWTPAAAARLVAWGGRRTGCRGAWRAWGVAGTSVSARASRRSGRCEAAVVVSLEAACDCVQDSCRRPVSGHALRARSSGSQRVW